MHLLGGTRRLHLARLRAGAFRSEEQALPVVWPQQTDLFKKLVIGQQIEERILLILLILEGEIRGCTIRGQCGQCH